MLAVEDFETTSSFCSVGPFDGVQATLASETGERNWRAKLASDTTASREATYTGTMILVKLSSGSVKDERRNGSLD